MKSKAINAVLWLAFLLALVASVSHLAYTFGTVERSPWWGWVSAVAVDAGLAALAYTIQQRKAAKRSTVNLWVGVGFFAFISAIANFYHALSVESGGEVVVQSLYSADWLELTKAVVLSATLPAMVIYLGEIVSGDDAQASEAVRIEAEKAERKAEREQRKAELEAERALLAEQNERTRMALEAEKAAAERMAIAQAAEEAHSESLRCEECGRVFGSRNAMNAHRRSHANGKVAETLTSG